MKFKEFDLLRDVLCLFVQPRYFFPSVSPLDIPDLTQPFRSQICFLLSTYKFVLHEWRYKLNKSNVYNPRKTNVRMNGKAHWEFDRNHIAEDHRIFLFGFDKPPMCTIRCETMNGLMSTFSMPNAHIE